MLTRQKKAVGSARYVLVEGDTSANLIAAASEMYTALKALAEVCENQPRIRNAIVDQQSPMGLARAAIAKAEGRS